MSFNTSALWWKLHRISDMNITRISEMEGERRGGREGEEEEDREWGKQ